MSPRLPRLTAREIVRVLQSRGFTLVRSSGSHHIFKDSEGRRVTVPVHAGQVLHPKVLRSILSDAEMTVEQLLEDLEH